MARHKANAVQECQENSFEVGTMVTVRVHRETRGLMIHISDDTTGSDSSHTTDVVLEHDPAVKGVSYDIRTIHKPNLIVRLASPLTSDRAVIGAFVAKDVVQLLFAE